VRFFRYPEIGSRYACQGHLQTTFVADLKALLEKYPTVNPIAMGFPQGWQEEPLWQ